MYNVKSLQLSHFWTNFGKFWCFKKFRFFLSWFCTGWNLLQTDTACSSRLGGVRIIFVTCYYLVQLRWISSCVPQGTLLCPKLYASYRLSMNILKNPPSKNSPLHREIWDLDRFSCWNYYASGTLPGRSWYKGVFRGYQLIPPFGYFSPSSRCAFRSLNILYFYNPQNYQNYLWINKINKIVIWTSWWLC